jgi:hypothetical protein
MAPPTIITVKHRFLTRQIRLLSEPLQSSRQFRRRNEADKADRAGEERIPDAAIEEALFFLNASISQHCARVYAPQATRQVAEHVESLYWNAAERDLNGTDGLGLGTEVDLSALLSLCLVLSSFESAGLRRTRKENKNEYVKGAADIHLSKQPTPLQSSPSHPHGRPAAKLATYRWKQNATST